MRTTTAAAPRRSGRSNAGRRIRALNVSSLTPIWRRLYLDVNHCRLRKCITMMCNASSAHIGQLNATSFVAMATCASSSYGASKEDLLLEYTHVVSERGLAANDSHNGNSAVVLAAYHGYVQLLGYLLDLECSLDSHGSYGNVIQACVRNSQHSSLELVLQKRPEDASALFRNDSFSVSLHHAIFKHDIGIVRILTCTSGIVKPTMSDAGMLYMKERGQDKRYLYPILEELYPSLDNVASWHKEIHWSFPTSDRHALNTLSRTDGLLRLVPLEIWLHIFSFIGRGWFLSTE